MKKLEPAGKVITRGILKGIKGEWFYDFQPGDRLSADDEPVVDRDEFFSVLDKASQPIKREAESDSKQSQT